VSISENGLKIDTRDFERGFKKITAGIIPPNIEKGLFEAMNELLKDAVRLPPQAPKKTGMLWASRADTVSIKKVPDGYIIEGGFNVKYARRWHEAEPGINWTRNRGASQPGPKYLESKMLKYKKKYLDMVRAFIERGAR
jgi:hypothetical protein